MVKSVLAVCLLAGSAIAAKISPEPAKKVDTPVPGVDELFQDDLAEQQRVVVRGRLNAKLISAGSGDDGPGSGSYLFGKKMSLHLSPEPQGADLNTVLVVVGQARFCGPEKMMRRLCGLRETEILKNEGSGELRILKKCRRDADCELVEATHPCGGVEAINAANPRQFWREHYEKALAERRASGISYRCRSRELTLENTLPSCVKGECGVIEKVQRRAGTGEYCYQGSSLMKNQCKEGLICVNSETGKEAQSWGTGTCQK
ncbi:MAG: hypothetical protein ABIJ96_05770 [Elusimicrobiota bacterium]